MLSSDQRLAQAIKKGQLNPLHCAALWGNADMVKMYLTPPIKVDMNARDARGFTALYYAMANNHIEIAKLLLSAGADPNLKFQNNYTLLDYVISQGKFEFSLLLDGADRCLHSALIHAMKLWGFQADVNGICFGFSGVAKIYALSGKKGLQHFYKSLFLLKRLTARELMMMHQFYQGLHVKIEQQVLSQWGIACPSALDEKERSEYQKDISQSIAMVRSSFTVKEQEKETQYHDILTLFNAFELLYHGGSMHYELLKGKFSDQKTAAQWVVPLIQTSDLEKKGSEVVLKRFSGTYWMHELSAYLATFRQRVKAAKNDECVALSLYSLAHAIGIIYDPVDDTWQNFNVNDMPSDEKELKNYILSGDIDISAKVASGFFTNDGHVIFQTQVSTSRQAAKNYHPFIEAWYRDIAPYHIVTSSKAKLVDHSHASWLFYAAAIGEEAIVNKLLAYGASVAESKNLSPMYLAAQNGQANIISILLQHSDVEPDKVVRCGATPLIIAVKHGHTEVVKLLLDTKKINPNIRTEEDESALSLAVMHGYKEITEILLQEQTINLQGSNGVSLLSLAAQQGHIEVIKTLLAEKSLELDPNECNQQGLTALHIAASLGYTDIIDRLLRGRFKTKIKINALDIVGNSALHYAALKGRVEVTRLLLSARCSLNVSNGKGLSPLWIAAASPHPEVVKVLVEAKAKVDVSDENNSTALMRAVLRSSLPTVQVLLDAKAELNKQSTAGLTAMMMASHVGSTHTIKALVEAKADINIPDYNGRTVLHALIEKASVHNLTLGFFKPVRVYGAIELVIKSGAKLDAHDRWGKVPIDYANDLLTQHELINIFKAV